MNKVMKTFIYLLKKLKNIKYFQTFNFESSFLEDWKKLLSTKRFLPYSFLYN